MKYGLWPLFYKSEWNPGYLYSNITFTHLYSNTVLKERKRGGVTAGINCLSRTYLLPGPGLDAECKMVDSPGNVPALMESILVRRDSDITQSLAYSQTLSKPQILIPAEALQINVMVCSQCFFPPRPLFPFHELMGGCRECEHL